MAVIISKQMTSLKRKITFAYDDYNTHGESINPSEFVSVTLPNGIVASYDSRIPEAKVTRNDTIRIYTSNTNDSSKAGYVVVNGNRVVNMDSNKYYDYRVSKDVIITIALISYKINTAGKYTHCGIVTITEL